MPIARRMLGRLWRNGARAVDMAEGYRQWAPVYPARAHNPLMLAEERAVSSMVAGLHVPAALDVGTGTGRNALLLSAGHARRVVGVDLSMAMLTASASGTPRVNGSAAALPFTDGAFDLLTSSLMCGDLPGLEPWLGEAARVLKPGGHLVYSDFHPAWGQTGWTRTFTSREGRTFQLPVHTHSMSDHLAALRGHGFVIQQMLEPRVDERPLPVVLVIHAVRSVLPREA